MSEVFYIDHPMFNPKYEYGISYCENCETSYAGLAVTGSVGSYKCVVCGETYDDESPGVYSIIDARENFLTYLGAKQAGLIDE